MLITKISSNSYLLLALPLLPQATIIMLISFTKARSKTACVGLVGLCCFELD